MERYEHGEIEKKWQKQWSEDGVYETQDIAQGKENFYQLFEFAYPSGNLHIGHWYAFAMPDIVARYKRMKGYNVLYPVGFDAFGLPAENAAIKRGVNPRDWTYENMDHMRMQMRSMGASFDWSREVVTCDPAYYKWTQWLFLQLYKAGLAEHRGVDANWCPSCKTVLANEQVVSGLCERCDSAVEKRQMKQWQIGITQYADRLIDDLDDVQWPQDIKMSQKNWIGRSEGAELEFKISGEDYKLKVFTTRPDTLYGVTYMVVAPEHEIIQNLEKKIPNIKAVRDYVAESAKKSEIDRTNDTKEKTGVLLEGIKAINPANDEEIPVYVADYVLGNYGTGAIMAVPAHDERDQAFALKYDIPVRHVVAKKVGEIASIDLEKVGSYGIIQNNEGKFLIQYSKRVDEYWLPGGTVEDGESLEQALEREVVEETGFSDFVNGNKVSVVVWDQYSHTKKKTRRNVCHAFAVSLSSKKRVEIKMTQVEKDDEMVSKWMTYDEIDAAIKKQVNKEKGEVMMLLLDTYVKREVFAKDGVMINSGEFDGMESEEAKKAIVEKVGGEITTTYKLRDWTVSRQRYWGAPIPIIHCDDCGPIAVPDAQLPVELPDVEDYLPNDDGRSPLAKNEDFVNVSCPECGKDAQRETDTFDTFMCSSWYFLRYCDPDNVESFADMEKLKMWMPIDHYSGGAEHTTMHLLYSRFFTKALYDLGLVPSSEPYTRRMNRSLILGPDGNKMSKSKGNVIDPDDIVEKLGADTMRLYLAFVGPYNEVSSYPWNPQSIIGVRRFIERIWKLQEKVGDGGTKASDQALHKALDTVTASIENYKLNTGVSALMGTINVLEKEVSITKEHMTLLVTMLAPYAPHVAQEIWEGIGHDGYVAKVQWPEVDATLLVEDEILLIVQIGGKVRDKVTVAAGQDDAALEKIALASEKVQKFIGEKEIRKIIVIKGKLINIVI